MSTTEGPWEYDAESMQIIAPKCGYQWTGSPAVVARVEPLDYDESSGNGPLLAAAPELREMLARAVSLYERYGLVAGQIEGDPLAAGKWINQSRAVLAKVGAL